MHMSEIWHSKKNDCRLSRTQVITMKEKVMDIVSVHDVEGRLWKKKWPIKMTL